MLQLAVFFILWLSGQALLFIYLKKKKESLQFQDVFYSYLLSSGLGVVFSFAAWKANLFNWAPCIAFIGLAAYITYKLLEKKDVVEQIESATIPMGAYGRSYRPGSQGAAQQKSDRNFIIGAAVVWILVLLSFTVFNTDMRVLYRSAGTGWNIAGIILWLGAFIPVLNSHKQILPSQSGHWYWIATAALSIAGLLTMIGFQA